MKANQASFSVRLMCRVLGLSASGYYAWAGRAPSARQTANEVLLAKMRGICEESRETYGRPRMVEELRDGGLRVNHKRVGRLMKLSGLVGITRRKKWRTTKRDRDARPAPDFVHRNFTAAGPDQLWVADITYIPTGSGFLFLAVVVDAWSRRVAGWSMETHLRTDLVLQALDMAVWQRRPKNVVHHSDQGPTTTRCVRASLRRWSANCWTAPDPRNQAEARMAVFDHIESWYNPRRRHSALWATGHP